MTAPAREGAMSPPPARVRGNDWRAVRPPDARGHWPREGVSVVVPYFEAPRELALTLAALERQTYPRELMEVVVVDDGSEPRLAVPPDAALDIRVVRQARLGFGLARARNAGVLAARHPIVVFLDGDLVADDGLVAAHARWHHAVADAVTLGFCAYVDAQGIEADALRRHGGPTAEVFRGRPIDRPWTERHMARTDDLTAARDDLFRSVVGNNLGIRRTLFDELGGFHAGFDRYGWEDTEFGWRAQTFGALLVPVREAFSWHQGRFRPNRTAAKRLEVAAQSAKGAALIPHAHFRRVGRPAAAGSVPRTVVRVQPGAAADCLLRGADPDLVVEAEAAHPAPAAAGERGGAAVGQRAAAFVVDVPANATVDRWFLARMRAGLGDAAVGVATLADGAEARITRTSAVHRAHRAGGQPADYGAVARFALTRRSALAAALRAGLRRLLPAARRPLSGLSRVATEVAAVRSAGDARRVGRWLAVGFAWWVATHRGRARGARRRPGARRRSVARPLRSAA